VLIKLRQVSEVLRLSAAKTSHTHSGVIEKMEKMLAIWIEDQNQHNDPVNLMILQPKAKSLSDDLKAKKGECSENE
jgi:hypothetical protein